MGARFVATGTASCQIPVTVNRIVNERPGTERQREGPCLELTTGEGLLISLANKFRENPVNRSPVLESPLSMSMVEAPSLGSRSTGTVECLHRPSLVVKDGRDMTSRYRLLPSNLRALPGERSRCEIGLKPWPSSLARQAKSPPRKPPV